MPLIPIALALATFVPDIVRWITGSRDAEAIAGRVVDVAKSVTGLDDAGAALAAIRSDPEKALAFRLAVMQRAVEFEQLYYADLQNARARDIEFLRAGHRNWRADIMVMSAATGLVVCLAVLILLRGELPGEAVGIISTISGIFGSCLKDAFTFEFGSSRGSAEKTEALVNMARTS